ncbi:MAG: hypothetical protein WDZ77_02290 [Candidatus Pacearchaeota archaeon]
MAKENWIKKHPVWSGVIGVLLLFILIGMFSGGDNSSTTNKQYTDDTKTAVEKMTALEQMEIAFVGGYSYDEIKNRIDSVMQQYGLSMTNENYSRFGSALVAVRKETGASEMDILTCMKSLDYRNTIGWDKITAEKAVPDAVGLCGATLSS